MAVRYLGTNSDDGTCLGLSATLDKVGFFAATPVVQPTSASQAAATGATTLIVLANQIRAELVALGLIKGA